jgi:hypothetical protein
MNALEAFKSVPRRGLEIGGILLGRTEKVHDGFTTVYIQGFETVESEHRSGPSYVLSESDLEHLDRTLRKHPDAVGVYRTHTRSETMQLEEDDTRLLHRCFKGPDRVFLLVQPMTGNASVFVNEGGKPVAVHEFPFRRNELVDYSERAEPAAAALPAPAISAVAATAIPAAAGPAIRAGATVPTIPAVAKARAISAVPASAISAATVPAIPATTAPAIPAAMASAIPAAMAPAIPAATAPPISPASKFAKFAELAKLAKVEKLVDFAKVAKLADARRPPWLKTAVAAGLGFAAGAAVMGMRQEVAAPVAPVAAAVAPVPEHVTLRVEREGRAIRLEWDRTARAIRQAAHGIVYVTDGSRQIHLDLAQPELDSGFVSYWPETSAVTFRLETYAADKSTSDTVRVVGAITTAPEPAPVKAPRVKSPRVQSAEPSSSRRRPQPQPVLANHAREADVKPSPLALPGSETVMPPPPESRRALLPDTVPAMGPVAAAPEPAPHPARAPDPNISVIAEPLTGSRFGRVVGKIPLLRRLRKQNETFTPPSPSHEVRPELNEADRRSLRRAVPVDVKVYVAESGKVKYAELLSDSRGDRRELASAAVYAARRWDFVPARLGDENVPGEVILHFRFAPAE